jgi:hypothetical protein
MTSAWYEEDSLGLRLGVAAVGGYSENWVKSESYCAILAWNTFSSASSLATSLPSPPASLSLSLAIRMAILTPATTNRLRISRAPALAIRSVSPSISFRQSFYPASLFRITVILPSN